MNEVFEQSISTGKILGASDELGHTTQIHESPDDLTHDLSFHAGLRTVAAKAGPFPELSEDFFFARLFPTHYITATTDQIRVRAAIGAEHASWETPPVYDEPAEITFGGKINRCAVSNDGRMLAVSVGDVLSIYSFRIDGQGLHLKPIASYPFADYDVEEGNISFSQDRKELFAYTRSGIHGRFPVEERDDAPEFRAA